MTEDTDGTIPLFQQIVGDDYKVMASEEVEQHIMDRCINPVEAAGFRMTMKTLALGLKEAVKKGKNIRHHISRPGQKYDRSGSRNEVPGSVQC